MAKPTPKVITVVAGIIVVVAIVAGVQLLPFAPGGGVTIGGPFTLIDQNGKQRRDTDFKGQFMLVYFGYTYCPDVCPTELNQMGLALDELAKEQADKVRPIFITIDPKRDTPARMKEYAENFHPRLVALTGDDEAIKNVAKAYRAYYARSAGSESETDYLMDHSSIIYLLGPDGRYVTHFNRGTEMEKIAARLREHLS